MGMLLAFHKYVGEERGYYFSVLILIGQIGQSQCQRKRQTFDVKKSAFRNGGEHFSHEGCPAYWSESQHLSTKEFKKKILMFNC